MRYYIFLVFFFSIGVAHSQNKAEQLYAAGYFQEAANAFEKQLNRRKVKDKVNIQRKLADCYFQLRKLDRSQELYLQVLEQEPDAFSFYRLIQLYRYNADYLSASQLLSQYGKELLGASETKRIEIEWIAFPMQNQQMSWSFEWDKLLLPNTRKGMGYTILLDTTMIAGVGSTTRENRTRFYDLAALTPPVFQEAKKLGLQENIRFFRAYPSYDEVNNRLYFTQNISKRRKQNKNIEENIQHLFYADGSISNFSKSIQLPFCDGEHNFSHPYITRDGNRLFFISDKPGGFGGLDIYFSDRTEEGWTEPVNAGAAVNTPFDELTPHFKNDTLFFSSYGHENYGGSDIFYATFSNGRFESAQNIGLPINSARDDFAYLPDERMDMYLLTTNRVSETGNIDEVYRLLNLKALANFLVQDAEDLSSIPDARITNQANNTEVFANANGKWKAADAPQLGDVFAFSHPQYFDKTVRVAANPSEELAITQLQPYRFGGQVVDDISQQPIERVSVEIFRWEDSDWQLVEQTFTDENGDWSVRWQKDKEYRIVFQKRGYDKAEETVAEITENTPEYAAILERFQPYELRTRPEEGTVFTLRNIYFDFDRATLRPISHQTLDKLANFMASHPEIHIELGGHTDCFGDDNYNLALSRRRARACKDYLVNKGVSEDRITYEGYGKTKMIVADCAEQRRNPAAAQRNRRTEVKITKGQKPLTIEDFDPAIDLVGKQYGGQVNKNENYQPSAFKLDNLPAEVNVPSELQANKYYLVAGSYTMQENAQRKIAYLKENDIKAQMITVDDKFYVIVGVFENYNDAKKVKENSTGVWIYHHK